MEGIERDRESEVSFPTLAIPFLLLGSNVGVWALPMEPVEYPHGELGQHEEPDWSLIRFSLKSPGSLGKLSGSRPQPPHL